MYANVILVSAQCPVWRVAIIQQMWQAVWNVAETLSVLKELIPALAVTRDTIALLKTQSVVCKLLKMITYIPVNPFQFSILIQMKIENIIKTR